MPMQNTPALADIDASHVFVRLDGASPYRVLERFTLDFKCTVLISCLILNPAVHSPLLQPPSLPVAHTTCSSWLSCSLAKASCQIRSLAQSLEGK